MNKIIILIMSIILMFIGMNSYATMSDPDSFGYYYIDGNEANGPLFEWEPVVNGTSIIMGGEDTEGPFDIGFDFEFYGITYNQVYINSNGFLTFDIDSVIGCCAPDSIPEERGHADNLIAGFWDDLDPGA